MTDAETPPRLRYRALAPQVPEGRILLGALVPGTGELEVEIGFGRGMFLLERARAAPTSRIVGLEIKRKLAFVVAERLAREGLRNGAAFAGDAREILSRSDDNSGVSRFFINFPDPWWKKRHAKRRVLSPALLTDVQRLLRPGGELFVQTDVEERATALRDELDAHAGLLVDAESGPAMDNPYGARSNRERRAIADGLPIFRILARKA